MPAWPIAHRSVLACLFVVAAAWPAGAQSGSAAPSIHITLSSAHERFRAPIAAAAEAAAGLAHEWLGPHRTGAITIADRASGSADVTLDLPVWQGPGAMAVERRVAAGVIRSWWPQPAAADAAPLLDGIALYLEGRAIERLFDRRFLRRAYRADTVPLFGGHIIWSFPALRLTRESAVAGSRHAAAVASLETWLGEPALQGALSAAAQLPQDQVRGRVLVDTLSAAAGQDVGWLFATADDPDATVDYAVTGMASAAGACATPCFDTTVTVVRLGRASFTGRAAPRAGGFESGDALALRVTFDNGDRSEARWDGRDESRTFRFQGPSPAVAAHLDPERVVRLDANRLNNAIVTPTATNAPVPKWIARWMVWMQNTVLSYGFFA
jgi:hypothetical protein